MKTFDKEKVAKMVQETQDYIQKIVKENQLDAVAFINNEASSIPCIAGYPEITVPFGENDKKEPRGATFFALADQDEALANLANAFEEATKLRLIPEKYKKALSKTQPKLSAEFPIPSQDSQNTVYPVKGGHILWDDATIEGVIDNIIVVFTKEGVSEEEILSWFPGEKPSIVGKFPGIHQFQVRIKPRSKKELDNLALELMMKDSVSYAHPELVISTLGESQEEFSSKPSKEWWYEAIGLDKAGPYLPRNPSIKVGVVDDGFDTKHPDLNLVFPSEEQEEMNRPEQHGTHVAGIIQQILPHSPITVTDSYPIPEENPMGHLATQTQFMKYLVDMVEADVKVINYSMGSDRTDEKILSWNKKSSSISSVYIWKLKEKGRDFLLVQSAGNIGVDTYLNGVFSTLNAENCLGSPAEREALGVSKDLQNAQQTVFDSIVLVGACGPKDSSGRYPLATGTNYGDSITIVAPGVDINSTVPGGYMLQTGTSQAAPMVSATLGIWWSLDPSLTSGQLKQLLIHSSTTSVFDENKNGPASRRKQYPLLNLYEGIQRLKTS